LHGTSGVFDRTSMVEAAARRRSTRGKRLIAQPCNFDRKP